MMLLFFALFTLVLAAEDSSTAPPLQCPDNPAFCMLDLLKSWEELRITETNATNVLLPIVYYTKGSLITLCESYSNLENKCGLGRCHVDNPVASFVTRHFSFVCQKDVASKYFENQNCISSTLVGSKCTEMIKEEPKIGGEMFCPKLDEFVLCVEEPLRTSCGNEVYALVMKAVEKYGCPSKIEVARVNEFLSIGVESSTVVISENAVMTTSPSEIPEKRNPEVNMLVNTSLQVDDEKTTPVVLKEEVTSSTEPSSTIPETTTSHEFVEDQIIGKSIDVRESSGEALEESTTTTETTTTEKETTITTEETVETRKPRKRFNAENMTDCYTSIVGDFGRFLHSSPTASFVRFPLFGIKPMELEVLCAKYEVATECVNSFCVGNCRLPAIKSFVDSQLKETCAMKGLPDFELEFTCLQNVLKENTECVSFLNSTNPNRCDGHPQFRNCIVDRLLGDCSEETVRLMDKMENGFGCKLLIEQEIEENSDGSGEIFEGSGSGDTPQLDEQRDLEGVPGNLTEDKLLTDDIVEKPRVCEGIVKTSALSCLAPLLRLWTGIKENRKDTEVVFPIFEFSKIELLELCDSFANYRSCVKYTDTSVCKSEPVISFAEEHFGQVCTTQQIEASMRTHDCINAIDSRSMAVCQKFSRGETLPGKRKCPKVRRYTKCLRKLVSTSCGHLMLAQFDMIVHRFGC